MCTRYWIMKHARSYCDCPDDTGDWQHIPEIHAPNEHVSMHTKNAAAASSDVVASLQLGKR